MLETAFPSPRSRWLVFAAVLAADVMDLLSTTITNLAAPSIVRDLRAPQSLAPWLGSAYALALGSMLVLGARLGDRYGTRAMFLLGLAGFTLASLTCAVSVSAAMIVAARSVQGMFGALLIPQGFSLLMRVFPREELGRVFGLFGPLMAASSISGPVLAGFLLWLNPLGLDWRAVFLINVVIGALLYPVSARVLPRGGRIHRHRRSGGHGQPGNRPGHHRAVPPHPPAPAETSRPRLPLAQRRRHCGGLRRWLPAEGGGYFCGDQF